MRPKFLQACLLNLWTVPERAHFCDINLPKAFWFWLSEKEGLCWRPRFKNRSDEEDRWTFIPSLVQEVGVWALGRKELQELFLCRAGWHPKDSERHRCRQRRCPWTLTGCPQGSSRAGEEQGMPKRNWGAEAVPMESDCVGCLLGVPRECDKLLRGSL